MNILVVRLGALGDIVHTIPAIAALRTALPDVRVDWIVEAKNADIVQMVAGVNRVLAMDGRSFRDWTAAVHVLRAGAYDAALDFQGLMKSALLARVSGARKVAGFSIWHLREKGARPFYSDTDDAGAGVHVIRKNLSLLRVLGIDTDRIEFPLVRVHSDACARVLQDSGGRPFALINPGAAWPNKRWPAARFGEVAAFLHEVRGMRPVVLWGPGEAELAREVVAASGAVAIEAPPTRVPDIIELAREAALVVSGDTGPLHLAAAAGAPIVALMGPTDPGRNGPWSPDDVVVNRFDRCDCHYERRCHQSDWCLATVTTAEVTAAIQQRLSRPRASAPA